MSRCVVAIDGPAGAGKSTVAQGVATVLGYALVDTGALYRAVALLARESAVDPRDAPAVEALARDAVTSGALRLSSLDGPDGPRAVVWVHGVDPGERLRTPEMSMGASIVSAHPGVRAALLDVQRALGADGGIVLEGRDIGTVVFPDARVKIFLTASPEVRGRRRWDELRARGVDASLADTIAEVIQRDAQDVGRAIAPLRKAPDALELDASDLDAADVIARIVGIVRARA